MPSSRILKIVSRTSKLAMWQANTVKDLLSKHHTDLSIEIIGIKTKGDKILDAPLAKIGGKGLFVKELEHCLSSGEADIAVHSMKDVPYQLPTGLELYTYLPRHDPSDAFVSSYNNLSELPPNSRVGTSSLRRKMQLLNLRKDLEILDLRGNVGTRLSKLADGQYDAIILATAGLERLGLDNKIADKFSLDDMLPAVGQGAMGVELRSDDLVTKQLLDPLNHQITAIRVQAERAMNAMLGGSCQVPIAGYSYLDDNQELHLEGRVGDINTGKLLIAKASSSLDKHIQLGEQVAEELLNNGAKKIIDAIEEHS